MADTVAITSIQVAMIVSLGQVFGIEISRSGAEAMRNSAMAAMVGKTVAKVLCGWIPVVGNVINACTGATITEALGWLVVEEFAKTAARFKR